MIYNLCTHEYKNYKNYKKTKNIKITAELILT